MNRIEMMFEYSKKNFSHRCVKATDGTFRLEKKGPGAKKFKPYCYFGGLSNFTVGYELEEAKKNGSLRCSDRFVADYAKGQDK